MSADDEATKYVSETRYIFAHAITGEILRSSNEDSFAPIPDEGDRIKIGETKTIFDEGSEEWIIEDSQSQSLVVTDIEYIYNYVTFERDSQEGQRLLTEVWIYGEPIQEVEEEGDR